jgi:broad specificity phosphatase PhoE
MNGLPTIHVVRHAQTLWSLSGQHTGRTDLPLTEHGEANARQLAPRLTARSYAVVLTSPLQRAARTCELAGFGGVAEADPDLMEWDYGAYEGRRSVDILAERPDWDLYRDGCPGGEAPAQVASRADRVVRRVRALDGDVLVFSSSHFLRVFAARWLGLPEDSARYFVLDTTGVCALGYEHTRQRPAIRLWNDTSHLGS